MKHPDQIKASFSVLLSALCLTVTYPSVEAAGTQNDAMVKLLTSSKIFAQGTRISAIVSEPEATVSTYLSAESTDVSKDCKIDAVLVAKKVMEINNKVVKVTTRFYAFDQSEYVQVVVSKGDVASFDAGLVDKQSFLASLSLTRVENKASVAPPPTATKASTAPATKPVDNNPVFEKAGLRFSYPKTWTEVAPYEGEIGHLNSVTGRHMSISIELRPGTAPSAALQADLARWNSRPASLESAERPPVIYQVQIVKIGAKRAIPAYSQVVLRELAQASEMTRYVYIGYFGKVYRIKLIGPKDSFSAPNADFNAMLATLSMSTTTK